MECVKRFNAHSGHIHVFAVHGYQLFKQIYKL